MPFSATTWAFLDVLAVQKLTQMSTNDDELLSSVNFLVPMLSMTSTTVAAAIARTNTTFGSGTEARVASLTFTISASANVLVWAKSDVRNQLETVTGHQMRFQDLSAVNFGTANFTRDVPNDRLGTQPLFGHIALTGGTHTIEIQQANLSLTLGTATYSERILGVVIIPS